MSIVLDGSNASTGGLINSGTVQNSTSGTAITFTGIPSTAKRVTVMLSGVNTSNNSNLLLQLGSGSLANTGYFSILTVATSSSVSSSTYTNGIGVDNVGTSSDAMFGIVVLTLMGSNMWVGVSQIGSSSATRTSWGSGSVTLSGALDRVSLTSTSNTQTFTAGSVNILWE
jgi:hypothetical protein